MFAIATTRLHAASPSFRPHRHAWRARGAAAVLTTLATVSAVALAQQPTPMPPATPANGGALHSHMHTESPRLFFMHFWANDDAVTLARGLRSALDRMAVRRPTA